MNNIYVRLNNRKYKSKYDKIFRGLRIEKIDEGKIILLPQNYLKRKNKYKRIIEKASEGKTYILYSNDVQDLTNTAKNCSGKRIMKCMITDIIEYIFSISNNNSLLEDVYILVNEYTDENLELIEDLIQIFRSVNIVTSKISKFRRLERNCERKGILITVSNNKRKSLQKAKNIVNIDFNNQTMHKYTISPNATIINLSTEEIEPILSFKGIVISNYYMGIEENLKVYFNEFYGEYETKILLESFVNNYSYNLIKKYLKECKTQINQLVGINGFISKQEIKNHYKNSS